MTFRVAQIRGQLTELVEGMDLDVISGADAAVLVREFSLIEKVAASARTLAAARVAETSAWVGEGDRSAEAWLSRQTGTSVGAAARDLRTGKRAKDQPKTRAAMKDGSLSPEQAGAVADAVAVDPAAEEKLIETAKKETFKNLQDQTRRTRAAATDDEARAARHHRERCARAGTDAEGAFCLSLRGPALDGARIMARLKPLQEQFFREARAGLGSTAGDTFDNRCYDAVLTMLLGVAGAPAAGPAPVAGPSPAAGPAPTGGAAAPAGPAPADGSAPAAGDTSAPDTAAPSLFDGVAPDDPVVQLARPTVAPAPAKPPGGNNVKVIVRVDHAALLRGRTLAGETSEIAGLGPVPVSVVREMLDDAFLAVIVRKGRDVVTVAHHGRGLNVHQRTAIEAQGLRCSNIACNQSVGLQIDHRHPWVKDQVTKLDNQDPLCGPCHRRETHEGWHLEPGTGPRRFLPPARAG